MILVLGKRNGAVTYSLKGAILKRALLSGKSVNPGPSTISFVMHSKQRRSKDDSMDSKPSEAQKFDAVMRKILSVSKDELKKREMAWRRKRERAKKKRAIS